jgi:hypothetical protein
MRVQVPFDHEVGKGTSNCSPSRPVEPMRDCRFEWTAKNSLEKIVFIAHVGAHNVPRCLGTVSTHGEQSSS